LDLAIAYQQQGDAEEARQVAAELKAAQPDFNVDAWARG
jgi:hypothetical protein